MPVHLMPGPQAGPSPPGKVAPIATGPPGLAAIFAALLFQKGSSAPQIPAPPRLAPQITKEPAETETEKNAAPPLGQRKALKIKQTPPLKASAAAAKTQIAMDTLPVFLSSPGKSANRKPDGELPLSEARTPVSVAPSALPAYLPVTSVSALAAPAALSVEELAKAAVSPVPAAVPTPHAAVPLPRTFAILPRQAVGDAYIAEASADRLPSPVPSPLVPSSPVPALTQPLIDTGRSEEIGSAAAVSQPTIASATIASQLAIGSAAQKTQAVPMTTALFTSSPSEQTLPVPEQQRIMPVNDSAALTPPHSTEPETLTMARLSQETSSLPQAAATAAPDAVRQAAPSVKTVGLSGKSRTTVEVTRVGASLIPTLPLSEKLEQPSAGSPVLLAEKIAPEESVNLSSTALPTTPSAPHGMGTERVVRDTPTAAPTEKPLQTGAMSADTQTVNTTRMPVVPTRQPLPTPGAETVVAKPAEKASEGEAVPLIPNAAPAAPATSDKPATLPPLSHTERAQIVKQTAEGLGRMRPPTHPAAPEQMTIQLHPKDWGKLQVSVTLAPASRTDAAPGQKAVTAHIVAETRQIKAALESQSGELRHTLRAAGMNLDKLTVSVQSASHAELMASSGGSQPQTNLGGSGSGNGQPSGSAFASFAGNPQSGRQGQSPGYPAVVGSPEPEAITEPLAPRQLMRGQIDTRA